jgi:transposase
MGGDQADVAEQGARRASCGRSTCPQRHLLGAAIRRTMARSAGLLWPMHHLLQPFRPVAKGRSVGADHGRTCAAHDAAVQMIDTSIVRVHQHAAMRYDKLAANYLAFIQLASIRLWLRVYEFRALAHGRAKLCDQALRKLTNLRTFDIAQKGQNEKHYALERPSDRDPEQLQMLRG